MTRGRVRSIGRTAWVFLTALAAIAAACAGEPDFAARLPRIAPLEPEQALRSFHTAPGYHLELVAAEPLTDDPVAVDFDADGRMYVVEMRGYSEQRDERRSQVRILEDTDGDGRADRSRVFLDELLWPTAVLCYDGGAFVADAPDLFYARDTDGDGRADERRVVFTGFLHHNVQGLVNCLRWGLDGRVHVATSTCGANLRRADRPDDPPFELRGRDFAFNPRTLQVEATSGGGQHGMCFDDAGRKFVCANSDHIQLIVCEDRYLGRNPWLGAASARESIAADGPQAEVFRASPVEAWRTLRTELRVAGRAPGPIEGGGRAAGYFTGATGITIYGGDACPDLRGQAFVGDVGGNLVHRKRLTPRGVSLVAERIDVGCEIVASDDIWFRPAQFANAPDGTLYILDVYREVIEHPDSLPPEIKRHLDLTSGRDRGRIYRLAPDGFASRAAPKLSQASTRELAQLIAHRNAWHRQTAARLLAERRDEAAIEPLSEVAATAPPEGRLQALYLLDPLGGLTDDRLLDRLADDDPQVRRHAVRLAERRLANVALAARVLEMAGDPAIDVRYQVAFTLGEFPASIDVSPALAQLVRSDGAERHFDAALVSSLGDRADAVTEQLLTGSNWLQAPTASRWLGILAAQHALRERELPPSLRAALLARADLGAANEGAWLAETIDQLARWGDSAPQALARLQLDRAPLDGVWSSWLADARRDALDAGAAPNHRQAAIELLRLDDADETRATLAECLRPAAPTEVQQAALTALAADERGVPHVIEAWTRLSPPLRRVAVDALLARSAGVTALLDAVQAGQIEPGQLAVDHAQRLLAHPDEALRRRAAELLPRSADGVRGEVVKRYSEALRRAGDAPVGRELFRKHCAACHRLEGVGNEIGAQLDAFAAKGPEAVLAAVLDPNREVNPQYSSYVVTLVDGRVLTGLIAAESAGGLTLVSGDGRQEVPRSQIESLDATGKSLMPEGFEQQLDPQAMADLLAYLLRPRE